MTEPLFASDLSPPGLDALMASYAALRASLASFSGLLSGAVAEVFPIPGITQVHPGAPEIRLPAVRRPDDHPQRPQEDLFDTGVARPPQGVEWGKSIVCIENELWNQPIPVEHVSGPKALRRARRAYLRLVRRPDQPPSRPDRTPGVIWLAGKAGEQARRAALAVNAQKQAFEAACLKFERHPERRIARLRNTPLSRVVLEQAYRQVPWVADPGLERVHFSWSGASRVVRRLTREQAIERAEALSGRPWDSPWAEQLRALPDAHFAWVRRLAPFVVANLKIEGRWQQRRVASVPILCTGPRCPMVQPLSAYVPGAEPGQRRRKSLAVEDAPLIESLSLYRYRRERGAAGA